MFRIYLGTPVASSDWITRVLRARVSKELYLLSLEKPKEHDLINACQNALCNMGPRGKAPGIAKEAGSYW